MNLTLIDYIYLFIFFIIIILYLLGFQIKNILKNVMYFTCLLVVNMCILDIIQYICYYLKN
jgi:hypothetical protein